MCIYFQNHANWRLGNFGKEYVLITKLPFSLRQVYLSKFSLCFRLNSSSLLSGGPEKKTQTFSKIRLRHQNQSFNSNQPFVLNYFQALRNLIEDT